MHGVVASRVDRFVLMRQAQTSHAVGRLTLSRSSLPRYVCAALARAWFTPFTQSKFGAHSSTHARSIRFVTAAAQQHGRGCWLWSSTTWRMLPMPDGDKKNNANESRGERLLRASSFLSSSREYFFFFKNVWGPTPPQLWKPNVWTPQ